VQQLQPEELFRFLESLWSQADRDKRDHDALVYGFLAYMIFQENREKGVDEDHILKSDLFVASDWILRSASSINKKFRTPSALPDSPEPSCSFCQRTAPEVRLAAGPDVFICDECVSTLGDVFDAGEPSPSSS
jgi:hypothetical protein